jgi:hypothetical protein
MQVDVFEVAAAAHPARQIVQAFHGDVGDHRSIPNSSHSPKPANASAAPRTMKSDITVDLLK